MANFYEKGDLIADGKDVYVVEDILGKGGMARVYRARDIGLNKLFVVKVLDAQLSASSSLVRHAFEQEARALAQMGSDHVPIIRSLGSTSDEHKALFYVMEHVNGSSLKALIDHVQRKTGARRLPLDKALGFSAQVAEGLGEIHEFGVTHCDIKPDNVLLYATRQGETRTKIIDFGVMHVHDDPRPRTFMGTPAYAAPEQLLERALTPKADVFALGIVLYEALVGRPAYEGFRESYDAALRRVEIALAPLPEDLEVPPELRSLLQRMLALAPEERPDAFVAGAALRKITRELAPPDPHTTPTNPNVGGLASAQINEARPLSIADVSTTDVDADMEEIMRHVEAAGAARAVALGDTEPGAPALRANGARQQRTVPLGLPMKAPRRTARMNVPALADAVTMPPVSDLPEPASARAGIYAESSSPPLARKTQKQETTPMPRPAATSAAEATSERDTPKASRSLRARLDALASDRGNRALLMVSAVLIGMVLALGAYAIGQRALSARPSSRISPAPSSPQQESTP